MLNYFFDHHHMLLEGSFDQHSAWQREFASWLTLLAQWMRGHDLLDTAVKDRLRGLGAQAWSDKVMVAFVAGFSRAKSELIYAFFCRVWLAHHARLCGLDVHVSDKIGFRRRAAILSSLVAD